MKKTVRIILFSIVLIFSVSSSQAGVIGQSLESSLQGLNPEDEIAVILTLADQLDVKSFKGKNKSLRRSRLNRALRDKADKSQKGLKKFLKEKKARKIKSFWIFNGMAAAIRADIVDELAQRPEVQSIQLDAVVSLPAPTLAAAGTPEWNIDAIKAPMLWELGYTGTGVVVANMDTGVDVLHPDLAASYRNDPNSWLDLVSGSPTPIDPDPPGSIFGGHGTKTMGVMVGGDAGGTSIGVAPGAQWIAVRVFDSDGNATYTAIHSGYQWLLDPDGNPDTDDLPDVVNNSWGIVDPPEVVGSCITEFQTDIQALKAAGVAMVFSAGNQGPNSHTSVSPANNPESLAVGSVGQSMVISDFSSRGPSGCGGDIFPELVAPGDNVRTTDVSLGGFPNYVPTSGTSIAAPHVSGAIALLLSVNPQLTVGDLETLLTDSATDLGIAGWDNDYGKGLLDVEAANNLIDNNFNSIADGWELHFFGDLSTATATSDSDHDYYTDLHEYLNWRNEELDTEGQPYDPTVRNAPGGTGYDKPSILWLTLPAILNSATSQLP